MSFLFLKPNNNHQEIKDWSELVHFHVVYVSRPKGRCTLVSVGGCKKLGKKKKITNIDMMEKTRLQIWKLHSVHYLFARDIEICWEEAPSELNRWAAAARLSFSLHQLFLNNRLFVFKCNDYWDNFEICKCTSSFNHKWQPFNRPVMRLLLQCTAGGDVKRSYDYDQENWYSLSYTQKCPKSPVKMQRWSLLSV